MSGKEVSFAIKGGKSKGYLATPSQPEAPGVIVMHAWWGLNPFFESLCDRLASEGFVAFAPDLNQGKIVSTIDEAEQLMKELKNENKQAIVDALVEFMRARPEIRKDPLAVIGFSMGAGWALALAGEQPEDIGKVVLFYGVSDADFTKIKAEISGHFSDVDEFEPLEGIQAMEEDMHAAGLTPTFHIYPQMSHWFFEGDRPEFDPQAAEIAWKRTLEFLRK